MRREISVDSQAPTCQVKQDHQVAMIGIVKVEFGHQKLLVFLGTIAQPPLKIEVVTWSMILTDMDQAVTRDMLEWSSSLRGSLKNTSIVSIKLKVINWTLT